MKKLYAVALDCSCPDAERWKIHLFARTAEEAGIIAKRDKARPCTGCGQCYVWEVVPEEDLVDSIPRNTPAILRWLGLAPRHELGHARANEQYWRDVAQTEQAALVEERERAAGLERVIEALRHERNKSHEAATEQNQRIETLEKENAWLKKNARIRERVIVDVARRRDEKSRRIRELEVENARLRDRILNAQLYLDGSREHVERAGEEGHS